MPDKPIGWTLKNVPDDIYAFIKDTQYEREKECKCKKSIEQVIYFIIREHKKNL